jgi:hypothetical protein
MSYLEDCLKAYLNRRIYFENLKNMLHMYVVEYHSLITNNTLLEIKNVFAKKYTTENRRFN